MSRFVELKSGAGSGQFQASSDHDDVARLVAIYRRVDRERMRDLLLRNDALAVEAVGFCDWGTHKIGVIITPWFINLVLLPGEKTDWSAHRHGDKVEYALPGGSYDFIHGDVEDFGCIQACSLMSPVGDLPDQGTARLIAEEVMRQVLVEGEPDVAPLKTQHPISRRELLRGWRAASAEED